MINKLSAPRKLLLLVIVMSVFITGIGVYGISQMRAMQQQTKTLYADRVLPLEQLNNVRFNYLLGIVATVEQVHVQRLGFAEAVRLIEEAETSIKKNWDIYLTTYLTPEEKKLVIEASALLKKSGETVFKVKNILRHEDAAALNTIITNEFYPAMNPVLSKMNELLNLQVRVGKEVYDNSTSTYYMAVKKFILLIVLSLAFAIPFCYFLIKRVNRLIENLHTSNAIIAKSEKKCRALIENAGDAIFMLNNDTVITDVNDYACRMLGIHGKN